MNENNNKVSGDASGPISGDQASQGPGSDSHAPDGRESDSQALDEKEQRRLRLRVAAKLMLALAFFTVLYVVLSVMFHSDPESRVIPTKTVDIGSLKKGESTVVLWEGRPVLIYRRTDNDIAALQTDDPRLLDAGSDKSKQPAWAKNATRSRDPEWFVSIGVGTDFSCPIALLPPSQNPSNDMFMQQPWRGGFVDECRGARYDLAGRVYRGQYADENLIVPSYVIREHELILGG